MIGCLFTTSRASFLALSVSASVDYEKSLDPRFESEPQPANYYACIGAASTLYILTKTADLVSRRFESHAGYF